jgi:hypothetical protein
VSKPVQHRQEHRALDCEAELPVAELVRERAPEAEVAPEPLDHDRGAHLHDTPGPEASFLVALGQADPDGEAREAGHDAVDVAFRLQAVEAAEGADDLLSDLAAVAEGPDDLEVLVRAGGFRADEHGASLSGTRL